MRREKSLKGKKGGKGKRVFGKDKAYYAEQNAATSLGKHDSCRNGGNWGLSNKTSDCLQVEHFGEAKVKLKN